jgi:hypothetical protein
MIDELRSAHPEDLRLFSQSHGMGDDCGHGILLFVEEGYRHRPDAERPRHPLSAFYHRRHLQYFGLPELPELLGAGDLSLGAEAKDAAEDLVPAAQGKGELDEGAPRGVRPIEARLVGMPKLGAHDLAGAAVETDLRLETGLALEHAVGGAEEAFDLLLGGTGLSRSGAEDEARGSGELEGSEFGSSIIVGDAVPGSRVVDEAARDGGTLALAPLRVAIGEFDAAPIAYRAQEEGEGLVVRALELRQLVAHFLFETAEALGYEIAEVLERFCLGEGYESEGFCRGLGEDEEEEGPLVRELEGPVFHRVAITPRGGVPGKRSVETVSEVGQIAAELALAHLEAPGELGEGEAAAFAGREVHVLDAFEIAHLYIAPGEAFFYIPSIARAGAERKARGLP